MNSWQNVNGHLGFSQAHVHYDTLWIDFPMRTHYSLCVLGSCLWYLLILYLTKTTQVALWLWLMSLVLGPPTHVSLLKTTHITLALAHAFWFYPHELSVLKTT